MHHVLLLGAGKIGTAIARFLAHTGDYDVLVGDVDERALRRLERITNIRATRIDSSNPTDLANAMKPVASTACTFTKSARAKINAASI